MWHEKLDKQEKHGGVKKKKKVNRERDVCSDFYIKMYTFNNIMD